MQEIELKILDINVRQMTRRLKKLGAKQTQRALFKAESFDFPDRSLQHRDSYLRIRQEGKGTVLTFKGRRTKSKYFQQRTELECTVSDYQTMKKILLKLGMRLDMHHEKKRTSFVLGGVHFDMDEYPTIPPFVEIEGSQGAIKGVLARLGYTLKQTTKMTADQVLLGYGKNPRNQRFKK